MKFKSNPGIPYENGGLVALYVNVVVVTVDDGIRPLPKVEGVETTMFWTNEGRLGGNIPPVLVAEMRV
jgi:hypothetical protein